MNEQPILPNDDDVPASERESPPWTVEELARAKRRPRVFVMRRAMCMTQERFADEFMIPIGTLRDWEQGRAEPDAAARAYLRAIAGNADAVSRALRTPPRVAAAE
jgi:putative transcriptional regulator